VPVYESCDVLLFSAYFTIMWNYMVLCYSYLYMCIMHLISYDGGGTRGHEGQGVGDKPEDDGLLKETFIKWASSNRTLT
jgi:hypothetical protein